MLILFLYVLCFVLLSPNYTLTPRFATGLRERRVETFTDFDWEKWKQFQLRFSPSLANKPKAPLPVVDPSSVPDPKQTTSASTIASNASSNDAKIVKRPTFDPFDNPPPGLLVTDLPPDHILVLNKFAIVPEHFILATKVFKEQTHLLEKEDLAATLACIRAYHAFVNEGQADGGRQEPEGQGRGTQEPHHYKQGHEEDYELVEKGQGQHGQHEKGGEELKHGQAQFQEAQAGRQTEQGQGQGQARSEAAAATDRKYEYGELFAFFNSGLHSGASQPHRHIQLLPVERMRDGLSSETAPSKAWEVLADTLPDMGAASRNGGPSVASELPFQAFPARIHPGISPEELHGVYLSLYARACAAVATYTNSNMVESESQAEGEAKISYNMAMTRDVLVIMPRLAEGAVITASSASSSSSANAGTETESATRGDAEKEKGMKVIGKLALNGTVLAGTALVKSQAEWDYLREKPEVVVELLGKIGVPQSQSLAPYLSFNGGAEAKGEKHAKM